MAEISEEAPRTPRDILELALRKEQAAFNFYDRLLKRTRVGLVVDLLTQLREQENQHIAMIRKQIAIMERG